MYESKEDLIRYYKDMHQSLDQIIIDFIRENEEHLLTANIFKLLEWSYQRAFLRGN